MNNRAHGTWLDYRHEWISFRLFQAFVADKTDEQWLDAMSDIKKDDFSACFKDGIDKGEQPKLSDLAPFAQLVAWLIVTHHKLPIYPGWKQSGTPDLAYIDQWLDANFNSLWNSHNCNDADQKERVPENWKLCDLPEQSMQWRSKACLIASEARIKLREYLSKLDYLTSLPNAPIGIMQVNHLGQNHRVHREPDQK